MDAAGPAWIGTCTSKALVGDIHSEDLPLIGPVVPCGSSIRIGGIVCRSETRGLTCTNRDGDGFFLSRQRAEPF